MSPQPKRARGQEAEIRDAGAPDDADVAAGLPDAGQKAAVEEQAGRREPRFTALELRTRPTILGQPAAVVALALHDGEVPDDAELTRAEAEQLIADSQAREVQNDVEV